MTEKKILLCLTQYPEDLRSIAIDPIELESIEERKKGICMVKMKSGDFYQVSHTFKRLIELIAEAFESKDRKEDQ